VHDERNYRENEQKVNQPTRDVKNSKAQQPCYQQNRKQNGKDTHKTSIGSQRLHFKLKSTVLALEPYGQDCSFSPTLLITVGSMKR
jgi:hypothetical protein